MKSAKAWVATMQPQSFYDAYGIPVNVANIQAAATSGNWSTVYSNYIGGGWSPGSGPGGVQAAGAGKIRGLSPTGSINTVSEGYELELSARPTDNWNVAVNASKTKAYRANLSQSLSTFIEATHQRLAGDAGLAGTVDEEGERAYHFSGVVGGRAHGCHARAVLACDGLQQGLVDLPLDVARQKFVLTLGQRRHRIDDARHVGA